MAGSRSLSTIYGELQKCSSSAVEAISLQRSANKLIAGSSLSGTSIPPQAALAADTAADGRWGAAAHRLPAAGVIYPGATAGYGIEVPVGETFVWLAGLPRQFVPESDIVAWATSTDKADTRGGVT